MRRFRVWCCLAIPQIHSNFIFLGEYGKYECLNCFFEELDPAPSKPYENLKSLKFNNHNSNLRKFLQIIDINYTKIFTIFRPICNHYF